MKVKLLSLAVGLVVFLGLGGLSQSAFAGTTTLTFDEFSTFTVLTTQYQSLGVTISGADAYTSCSICSFPPISGTNVAFAPPPGLMTFTFDSAVVGGNVQTVSAYVTDYGGQAGIYAYDSSNNLLGQSLLPAGGASMCSCQLHHPAHQLHTLRFTIAEGVILSTICRSPGMHHRRS